MLRTMMAAMALWLLTAICGPAAQAAPDHLPDHAMGSNAPSVEEAKALVLKAADELSKGGLDRACGEFQRKSGPFWQGDLYVFVLDFDGVWRCYPPKPDAVGTVLLLLQDVDGKFFIQEMVDIARNGGDGWVEYKWKNPQNGQIQPKTSFVKRVGGLVVAAGVFR